MAGRVPVMTCLSEADCVHSGDWGGTCNREGKYFVIRWGLFISFELRVVSKVILESFDFMIGEGRNLLVSR